MYTGRGRFTSPPQLLNLLQRYCARGKIFHVIMSRLKPIALSNFVQPTSDSSSNTSNPNTAPLCPPVTGWRGNTGPVRNNFDDSGFFCGRTDSAGKRRRVETQAEIDAVYDLSRDYLTNNPPRSRSWIRPRLRKFLLPPPLWPATSNRFSTNRKRQMT